MEIVYHVVREEGLDTNRIPVLFACRLCICITVEREKSSILFYNLAPCPIYKEKLHVPRHSLFSSQLRVVLLLHVLPCPFIYIKKINLHISTTPLLLFCSLLYILLALIVSHLIRNCSLHHGVSYYPHDSSSVSRGASTGIY